MSSLTTTSINTLNGNTNLSLLTGNAAGPSVILGTSGSISLKANSTSNSVYVTPTSFFVNSGASFNGSLSSGGITSNGVGLFTSNVTFSGTQVTFTANVTANVANVVAIGLGNSSVSSSLAANGYTVLPNRLLINWGSASVTTAGLTATFSKSFQGNPFSVTIGPTSQSNAWITGANSTTVSLDSDATQTIYWTAIGQLN